MEPVLEAIEEMFLQPYLIFNEFTPEEDNEIKKYCSYFNALSSSTRMIKRFIEMDPPEEDIEDRYLVVWGALQAFVVQQDAIRHLRVMFSPSAGEILKADSRYKSWFIFRNFRNQTVGHFSEWESGMMTVALDKDDWGVLLDFEGNSVHVHSFVLDHLDRYRTELLQALTPVRNGIWERMVEQ
jgi:hypothetical protein